MPAPRPSCPRSLLLATGWLAAVAPALAQSGASLTELSLEQLSSIEVTSVGKRVQRLADVAGSVYVINQEDIRRSGATTLPEALRLAPNLQVARADANQYAITARGFATVLANKLLVLVDGRTVYSPLFSGVFWEAVDVLLDDVERIEVLSGAGGTLYGSNAVNGVINIITRNAAETSGGLVKLAAGDQERLLAGRWGGAAEGGATHWRVYAKRRLQDASRLESGAAVTDASHRSQVGFRADRLQGQDHWTLQGDLHQSHIEQAPAPRRVGGGNLLARWSREHGGGSRSQLQAFFDRSERDQPGAVDDQLDTWDIEFQHAQRLAGSHELLWGAGYRQHDDHLVNLAPAALTFDPADRRLRLWNLFAQGEAALSADLRLTLGLKAEHNSYTGLEWLPNARLAWRVAPSHTLWAAASRAVRAPSRIDRDVVTPLLPLGGAGFDSEVARVYELGYRAQPRGSLSYSLTLFRHEFDRLRSVDVLAGGFGFGNSYQGRLNGVETWGQWRFADRWRLNAGYAWQRMRLSERAGTTPLPGGTNQLGNDPRSRLLLGLSWDVAPRMELDVNLRRIGSLPQPAVPSYTAVDLRWGWHVRPDLELSLAVRNLNDPRHPEWGAPGARAEQQRAWLLQATWRL